MDYSNLQSRASTSASSYIPPHRTQIHPRMIHSFSTATTGPNPKIQSQNQIQQQKWIVLVSSLLTLPFVFYLFSTARKIHTSTRFETTPQWKSKSYGVVIQSGATGSRIRVYEFDARFEFDGVDGMVVESKKVFPGLAGFGGEMVKVKGTILELVEFAKGRVPEVLRRRTKVQLFASEEMEGLSEDVREGIMESCREVLRSSGFWFKNEWASVIKGIDKGVFAWVAVNYALGTLGVAHQETSGIVELGGAAMQVVFALKDPKPTEFSRTLKFAGVTYNLHAQSLPQYGQDAAWQTLQKKQNSRDVTAFSDAISGNPCLPRGFLLHSNSSNPAYLPGGNFSTCRGEAVNLLKETQGKCLQPPCKIISSPFVELRAKPVSPENFVYISESFGIMPKATLTEIEAAGHRFCEDNWQDQKSRLFNINELDLSRYCFSSAYIVALLHDVLGIKMNDERVGFTHSYASIPHDWTLGAFILQIMQEAQHKGTYDPNEIVGSDSITFFLLFSVLLVVVLGAFFALKWRRPQVKTIYDLEKGRYIITRVSS